MKKFLVVLLSLAFVLSFNGVSFADQGVEPEEVIESESVTQAEPVVVTAYRIELPEKASALSTEHFDADEYLGKGVTLVKDAIQGSRGVYVAGTGVSGATSVFIRGGESRHTQVLLDGITLHDPSATNSSYAGFAHRSLAVLDSVEINKGAFGSLYGSDAIGGTIHMHSKRGQGDPNIEYTQTAGSYHTYEEILRSQGEVGDLDYSVGFSRKDVNSFHVSRYRDNNHEEDPYSNMNANARFDYSITDNLEVGILADYVNSSNEYDGFSGDDNDNKGDFHQGVGGIFIRHDIGDAFSHKITLARTDLYRTNWQSSGDDEWYRGKTYQMKWEGTYSPVEWYTLVGGFDYLRDKTEMSANGDLSATASTKGYFLENIITPVDNLLLSGHIRVEDHSRFDEHVTYGFSAGYTIEPTNTKIKASWGTGFEAPSLYEMYVDYTNIAWGTTTTGNTDLQPEESESVEVGIEQRLFEEKLSFGTTYFHTYIKDMLQSNFSFPDITYSNQSKGNIWGFENFISYKINDRSEFGFTYSLVKAKCKGEDLGNKMGRRPENSWRINYQTGYKKFDLLTDFTYTGSAFDTNYSDSTKNKSYFLWNAVVKYQVNENIGLFCRVENILDQDYVVADKYETPGASAYAGFSLKY